MSKSVHLEEIRYFPDSCELFERIVDLPRAAFLDSSFPHASSGRYDILTAQPRNTGMPYLPPHATQQQCKTFFAEMNLFHKEHYYGIQPISSDIPFCGGVLGYLGYEFGNALHAVQPEINVSACPAA